MTQLQTVMAIGSNRPLSAATPAQNDEATSETQTTSQSLSSLPSKVPINDTTTTDTNTTTDTIITDDENSMEDNDIRAIGAPPVLACFIFFVF